MDTRPPSASPSQESAHARRRRLREGGLILITALGVLLFIVSQSPLPQFNNIHSLASNIVFVLLINLNIVLLVLIVFLVGRNLVKLFYERRQKLPGAHLRFRLVLAFVAISLLPALLLFLIGVGFVNRSIDNWFSNKPENSLVEALSGVDAFYERLADEALFHARGLANEVAARGLTAGPDQALRGLVEPTRHRSELGRILIFGPDRQLLAATSVPDRAVGGDGSVDAELLDQVFQNTAVRQAHIPGQTQVVRSGVPILGRDVGRDEVLGAVVVEYVVPSHIAWQVTQLTDAFNEYRQLRILKQPMKNSYVITMSLATLVAVFSAVWLGFFLSKKIAIPLQQLAVATREVAQGHWGHRLEGEGEDEVGTLVVAFNRMTTDLQRSHQELEARRCYMEILLANMNAGVVSLDRAGLVSTLNRAAERLLGVAAEEAVGRDYRDVFGTAEFAELRRMVGDLLTEPLGSPCAGGESGPDSQGQLRLLRNGQTLTLLVTTAPLTDEGGDVLGGVCFFEDVTQIIRVERMEAWREVACRIAHEIKNPLTPIQLAAQRLHRRFAPQGSDSQSVFNECVQSIAHEVNTLKRLVNEFSTFARLPTAEYQPEDLNALIREVTIIFSEAHRELDFSLSCDPNLPLLDLDREGIKRTVRNLLDNAVAACQAQVNGSGNGSPGHIEVLTRFFRSVGIVRLEVTDTGCGIPAEIKDRLFEPYFSTKKDGTGLGLAIVATVVADHQAFLRVQDNTPHGSRFLIELPVRRPERLSPDLAAAIQRGGRYG